MALGAGLARSRNRRRAVMSEINVTPVVDVMLVLLIVFMVAAPLLVVGVPVELPKTEAAPLREETEPLAITVRAKGQVFLQDQEVTLSELTPKLRAITGENPEARIYVRADGRAAYATVAEVMAKLQNAGFTKIGLLTDPLEP